MSTISTNGELIKEMKLGGELRRPIPGIKSTYVIERKGKMIRNVRRKVAESVLNDMRFRHVNERGAYIYMARAAQPKRRSISG